MNETPLLQHQRPGRNYPCPFCGTVMDIRGFHVLDPISCPTCGRKMVVPAKLGKYALYAFLGEGAMGRVYRARDPDLKRDVAIKILREDLTESVQMWGMLRQEAMAAARINHRSVIHVYDMGRVRGRPYIVMELAEMASLEERMAKTGPIPEPMALRLAIDVMEGLEAAYAFHLIHGDIKPANILLTQKDRAKIADFGLARFIDRETEVERWGTPYYIAPEKSRREQEDFRSDMYSLGATLFHALSGGPPYEAETGEEVIRLAQQAPLPKLADRAAGVSRECSELVHRMMRRDPDDRFWSYEQAIGYFKQLRDGTYKRGSCRRKHTRGLRNTWKAIARLVVDAPEARPRNG